MRYFPTHGKKAERWTKSYFKLNQKGPVVAAGVGDRGERGGKRRVDRWANSNDACAGGWFDRRSGSQTGR